MNIDDLRDELAELAGPEVRSTAQARDSVRARVRRTHRRQRVTGALSTVLAAALVVGIVGVGLNGKDDGVRVRTTSPTTALPNPECRFGAKTVPRNRVPAAVSAWADGRAVVGSGALWTGLAALKQDGTHDGSIYRLKIGWYAIPFGIPKIDARRLDGPGRAVGQANEAIDQRGKWIVSTIELPSEGCWEVTARFMNSVITFRRLIGHPSEPLAIGTVTGTLEEVGGPAPGAPRAVAGSVQIEPTPTRFDAPGVAIETDSRGRFRVDFPPGRYTVAGRSPQYENRGFDCQGGTITVRRGETTTVAVDCQID
jgi:hypothetical protein